jgi:hypothetical protein
MIELGYYYHYKHDPQDRVEDSAYEVIGLAKQTEDESLLVLYRPLYESKYLGEADCFARPLGMFTEEVERGCNRGPRFSHITDDAVVSKLEAIRNKKYPPR